LSNMSKVLHMTARSSGYFVLNVMGTRALPISSIGAIFDGIPKETLLVVCDSWVKRRIISARE
jgi:hypothetical protein